MSRLAASAPTYVAGEPGKRTSPGKPLETAFAEARVLARRRGYAVHVHRIGDSARMATVWPDGKIDLTDEGAKVA